MLTRRVPWSIGIFTRRMDSLMQKSFITATSILGLAFVLVGCGKSGGGSDMVATVNGETITKDEYIARLERMNQVLVQTQQGPVQVQVAQPLSFQAMNDLVKESLIMQMAKEQGVLPTERDVNDELTLQTTKRADFVSSMTSQGYTLTDIKNALKTSLARHNLLCKGITITDAQVDAYIKDNPKQFETPATVDMTWIVLKDAADKSKVDSEIKTGQTFAVIAKRFTTAQTGPQFPNRNYDQFPAKLKAIVDKLNENGTSDWVQDGTSFVKFHIEKKTPAGKMEVKPWMKTEIKRLLAEQKASAAKDLGKDLLDRLKQAKIAINRPGLKELFDRASQNLKEADMKTSSTNTGAAASNAPAANNGE